MKKEDAKRFFSPGAILRRLSDTARRFPLSVSIIAALAALAFIGVRDDDALNYRYYIFLGISLFVSVAATLAAEDRSGRLKTAAVALGAVLLCGVWCLFLPADDNAVDAAWSIEIGVWASAAFFAIFFVSFLGRGKDAGWWNFGVRILWRLVSGGIFAGILFGGLFLALFALRELFGMSIPDEAIGDLAVVCFIIFAPLYVLAGVPRGGAKHDAEMHPEPLLKVLALYILTPILALYTLILYGYGLKIVVTWQLPDGWVSWLVTALALGGLVVTLLVYPLRVRGGNRAVEFLSRWMGVIFLPLLVLMTVGIARRISDYGFTVNRAYILLLNLWFYGVYIYLFAVRGRRVKWILISAVAVGVVSSVGPWSIARVVVPRDRTDVEAAVVEAEDGDDGEFFGSYNMVRSDLLYELDGKYGKFAIIDWHGTDGKEGNFEYVQKGYELLIKISDDEGTLSKEVRIPLREAVDGGEIRGEEFFLLLVNSRGTQYAARDSIRVTQLKGYLFFD